MDQIKQWAAPLTERWNGMAAQNRAFLVAFLLSGLAVLGFTVFIFTRPRYDVLFSNLNQSDAGLIVGKLKEGKVPYELQENGSTITVPTEKVYDLRLQMASEGLPEQGNVGFEIFDKSSFGVTEFTQKMNYQRALQGELARTISGLREVQQARVHLALPEERLYDQDRQEPKASVALVTKPGLTLDEDRVSAITHLVASAVEGLKPENVTVVDFHGNLLSDAQGRPTATSLRTNTAQLQLVRTFEREVEKELQTMLDHVVGPGKSVTRVSAEMDFSHREIDRETYQPGPQGKGFMTSQQETVEKYTGSGKPGAAPGITANLLGTTPTGGGKVDGYERRETNNKWELSKQIERVRDAPGRIKKLSVAVVLDGQVPASRLASVKQMVTAAVGLDPARGDQVSVEALPFDNTVAQQQEAEMQQMQRRDLITYWVKAGLAVLLMMVFLLFMRASVRRPSRYEPLEKALPPSATPLLEALDSASPELPELSDDLVAGELAAAAPSSPDTDVIELARQNPEEVAQVVRTWLADRSARGK